jgi:hypothetical protein
MGDDGVAISSDRVMVDLPGGTAEVRSDFAIFPINELDPVTLEVVFAVGKSGDMAIFAEGLECAAIVLNTAQRQRLKESEEDRKACPICRSASQLGELLKDWHQWHVTLRTQALTEVGTEDPPSSAAAHKASQADTPRVVDKFEKVNLFRFDTAGNEIPKHPGVLAELKALCQRHFNECGDPLARLAGMEFGGRGTWPPFSVAVERDGYEACIFPYQVEFSMRRVVPAEFMWEVARVGDFTVVTNRGLIDCDPWQFARGLIVTDPGQLARLPKSWLTSNDVRAANSPAELEKLLWEFDLNIPDADLREPPIGTYPTLHKIIYFEAHPKETDVKHQNTVYKYKPMRPLPEDEDGPMMSRFWELKTPAGKRFFAYSCAGLGWLEVFREQGQAQGREVGQIINYETFVQDNGDRFPISECTLKKTR